MRRVFIGAGETSGSAQIYYWLLPTLVDPCGLNQAAALLYLQHRAALLLFNTLVSHSPADVDGACLLNTATLGENDGAEVGESDLCCHTDERCTLCHEHLPEAPPSGRGDT